jgi:hypothetical protein
MGAFVRHVEKFDYDGEMAYPAGASAAGVAHEHRNTGAPAYVRQFELATPDCIQTFIAVAL